MDQTTNNNANTAKKGKEIDIREVASFLLSKLWIIALVVLCCLIIAFLYTRIFITPLYNSQSKVLITNKTDAEADYITGGDISIAIQLAKTSEEIFTGYDYLSLVAEKLNSNEIDISPYFKREGQTIYNKFTDFYLSIYGQEKITASALRSFIGVSSNEDARTVTLTVTTPSPELSAIISRVATACMQDHMNTVNKSETVVVGNIDSGGRISYSPSNLHTLRNMVICAAIGFVVICAILACFFIFDDKIKVPDDIERHLKLNVLGEIPEIEEA